MLFNLGLTADAAAAHENEFLGSPTETQLPGPTRHSSPAISFASLPSWGLGSIYNRHKTPEPEMTQRTMSRKVTIDTLSSSDDERSTIAPVLAPSRIARSQSVRKQSSRPKTSYQLAHPAAHARHRRLKLRPKLLLQLQRVSQTPRPLPILDVLPSTVFLPPLARKFPTIFRGKKGLGPNDLIVVTSDLYERAPGDVGDKYLSSDDESGEQREVVATICQLFRDDALAKGKAEICLNHGPVWEATPLANGSYEFVANTDHGIRVLRWVLRGGKNRRVSAPPGFAPQEDSKRFTFSVINPNTRRHPVVGTMTRNYLEVYDEFSMPTAPGIASSPTSAMSVMSDLSEMEDSPDRKVMTTDNELRMLIIVTSIWVAFREGWSHNFTYDDSAMALNSKTMCPSRHSSPTAIRVDSDKFGEQENGHDDGSVLNGSRHRLSTSTHVPSQTTTSDRSTFGSLSRRSNSTGAAFIERTNRRASGSNGRLNRHGTLSSPREQRQDEAEEATPARQDSKSRRLWSHRKSDIQTPKKIATPDHRSNQPQAFENPQSRQVDMSRDLDIKSPAGESVPTKGKRRHRISNLFDFIIRKTGHHH
ncbi:uncharacterized protein BO80DRAFT_188286 [Aspergillus ibericus CBS 121593]|uniref:Uncharacterized protein n=1 Tax=Aspergillus ibericus CBS 121593 TaxID=1448316 RepID=A0A395GQ25_9EURO|nr:hypothetical protein BO80DRAFT_188286 [Aspergillus ibericus CBS 121593]RAK97620.1 hypothetical protein BO80DRAFT_188286 [Aspergillus ibericus CBS 121593]